MAVTVHLFNHTVNRFVSGANAAADTYIINLYSALTLNVANTTMLQVEATGTAVADQYDYLHDTKTVTCSIDVSTTDDATVDFTDASWTANGGPIGAARWAVLYNGSDADDPPVLAVDFGEDKTADDGTDFKVTWSTSGVITFTYTAP